MKKLLTLLTILSCCIASAQVVPNKDVQFTGVMSIGRSGATDASALLQLGDENTTKGLLLPRTAGTGSITSPTRGTIFYNLGDQKVYLKNNTVLVSMITSDIGVKFSDTAAMLLPYLRKIDTTAMLAPYYKAAQVDALLTQRLLKSDTAAMLSPYLRKVDTTAMLAAYLRTSTKYIDSLTINLDTLKVWRKQVNIQNLLLPAGGGGGGAGLLDGDYGDITVGGSGTTMTIDPQAVVFSKIQNISSARLLGRTTAGSGSIEQISGIGNSFITDVDVSKVTGYSGSNERVAFWNAAGVLQAEPMIITNSAIGSITVGSGAVSSQITVAGTGANAGVYTPNIATTSTNVLNVRNNANTTYGTWDFSQLTAASGNVRPFQILPVYNQASSTASNSDLFIGRTETALGSGAQDFIEAKAGSTTRFEVRNTGRIISGYYVGTDDRPVKVNSAGSFEPDVYLSISNPGGSAGQNLIREVNPSYIQIRQIAVTGGGTITQTNDSLLTINISGGGGGTGYATAQEEGSNLTARTVMNFIGSAITAADDGVNTRTNVTITDADGTHGGFIILGTQQMGTGRKSVDALAINTTSAQPAGLLLWSVLNSNSATPPSNARFQNTGTSYTTVDYVTDTRTWSWQAEGSSNPTPGNFHLLTNGTAVIDVDFVGNEAIGGAALTGRLNVRTNFPGIVQDTRTGYFYNSGSTFDCSAAARVGTVMWLVADATKSVAGNNYTNRALYATASGGDLNYAGIFDQGRVGVNVTTPTARLHLGAGTTAAGTAPLKINTGTAMTTPEDGALEYHSSHLFFTISSTRFQLDQQGLNSLNGLAVATQTFATGTTGTDFGIVSSGSVHTFNLPSSSASNRGLLTSTDWSTFNGKENALTFSTGLTRSTNTITANLSTGVSGGQTAIGGTGTTDKLTLKTTTANGAAGADMLFVGGNNGGTEFGRFLNSGFLGINRAAPDRRVEILDATNPQLRLTQTAGSHYQEFNADGNDNLFITSSSAIGVVHLVSGVETVAVGGTIKQLASTAANTDAAEDNLDVLTTTTSDLGVDNNAIAFDYFGDIGNTAANTARLRLYFGGTLIFDSGTFTTSGTSYRITGRVIRRTSTVADCIVECKANAVSFSSSGTGVTYTGVTVSNYTANDIKITGTYSTASAGVIRLHGVTIMKVPKVYGAP